MNTSLHLYIILSHLYYFKDLCKQTLTGRKKKAESLGCGGKKIYAEYDRKKNWRNDLVEESKGKWRDKKMAGFTGKDCKLKMLGKGG